MEYGSWSLMKKSWNAKIETLFDVPKPLLLDTPKPVTIHEVMVSGIVRFESFPNPFSSIATLSQIQVSGKFFRVLIVPSLVPS